jgi:hypothetical protein
VFDCDCKSLFEIKMSASRSDHVVEVRALAKLLLHSLKYPYATVTGVLLGRQSKKEAGDHQNNSDKIRIVDCVPLTHLNHGLTPMLEVGLLQTTAYASKHDLQIIAFYQANANFHDVEPDTFAQKVGDKLLEINEQAFILMVSPFSFLLVSNI